MFKKIKNLLTPDTVREASGGFILPYGLSEGEWRKLKAFKASDEWPLYLGVLDALVKFNGESLLRTKVSEDVHFLRGFISGLQKAGSVIAEQEARETAFLIEKRRRENVPDTNRSAALFGSPAWRNNANGRDGSS